MPTQRFRAIIVGGGPVGLTAAHALSRANIDFILLERRSSAVIDAGSNLVLNPMGLRALDQLGLAAPLEQVSSPLGLIKRQDHQGRDIGDAYWFILFNKLLGTFPRVVSRHDLTKVLYDSFTPLQKSQILTDKRVADIIPSETGVQVSCDDGTSYEGSIVIGADGAHSFVRTKMRSLAQDAGSEEVDDEKPFLTTFRALWLRMPTKFAGIEPGTTCETHGPGAATQLFAGEDSSVMGLYEKLDAPTRDRVRYTEQDQVDLVERWGHIPLAPGGKLTLKDAFSARTQSGLVSLEEGVVNHWSWGGRVVLAGDSAHKFTPSTGAGCNNGLIDVVALVNQLYALRQKSPIPTHAQLATAFQSYQASRMDPVVEACRGSGQATSSATWQTGVFKFIDKHIIGITAIQNMLFGLGAPKMAQSPKLTFIKGPERHAGKIAWAGPQENKVY
ncbi:zeaxanthin epoxidase chloroplastic [Fusarium napiforme]|uniref:Zeaxanthin epoxidase chloroplastic n=1 Tax=Fusarium napiforme TaxID=42672 RepID=A0A8H5K333_9HYPO|nr:zeaxanthin epoxidase chloroplastic [Fusarium napiforme]